MADVHIFKLHALRKCIWKNQQRPSNANYCYA